MNYSNLGKIAAITFVSFFLSACSTFFGDKLVLEQKSFDDLSGWSSDDHKQAMISFHKSCSSFLQMPKDKDMHVSGIGGTYGKWQDLCRISYRYNNNPKEFFEKYFAPFVAKNGNDDKGLFTGYYEIALNGSRHRHGRFKYPVYAKPDDLSSGQYFSRAEINKGALNGRGLEIAWVDDPVRLFFLHVQGSGIINMDDGTSMNVGFAAKNGREYSSIGKYMIDNGYFNGEELSADSVKNWLYANPDEAENIMEVNESYVFFREIGNTGPIGGQGVPLTPMRSIAIDKRFIPYGVPVWVDVDLNNSGKKFQSLVVAQDTGSAIKGPVRADLFFGAGYRAEQLAGNQKNIGRYFLLLPRDS